jgi:lysophospholipase L1-like esterase
VKRLLNVIANLVLIAIGLFLGLLAVEQAIPYYWHGRADYGWDGSLEYDPILGWRNRPNFSMVGKAPDSVSRRVEYAHNSKGLRDEEYPYQKPEGTYRILVLGDSFAYGDGVRRSEAFPEMLESLLKEHGSFEVINTGVMGYGLTQETLYYETEGYKYEPDLVMLVFYDNDLTDLVKEKEQPKPKFQLVDGQLVLHNVPYPHPSELETHDTEEEWLAAVGKGLVKQLRFPETRALIEGTLEVKAPRCLKPFNQPLYWEYAWQTVEAILRRLSENVEEHGGRLLVVTTPPHKEWMGCWSSPEAEIMDYICTHRRIPHIDLLAGFSQGGTRPYFRRDLHWNAEGHRLVAHIIYDQLVAVDFEPKPIFEAMAADFEDKLELVDWAWGDSSSNLVPHVVPSGEQARIALHWQQLEAREDYQVSVMLVDEQGHNVWQMDRPLLDRGGRGTSQWEPRGKEVLDQYLFPIPPATPPGEYRVAVALYPWATQVPLTVVGGGHGSRLEVGTFRIGRAMHQPEVEALGLQHPLMVDMGQEVRLIGCDLSIQGVAQPGERVTLSVYWQARRDVRGDYGLLVHLRDEERDFSVGEVSRLTGDAYPTTEWTKGEVLRGWYDFTLPPDVLSGSYQLVAQVVDMARQESLGEAELDELIVEARPRSFEVPPIPHLLSVNLGGQVEFLGYDLKADHVTAGDTLHLCLYWRALAGMETSYKVFTHLLGHDDRVWGQKDDFPGQGELLTNSWVEGEVIVDEYEITVDPGAPGGDYQLAVGMYDPASGARLPILDEKGGFQGDRILLKKIAVGKQ